jgi:sulfonate transport system substrate-binding protein
MNLSINRVFSLFATPALAAVIGWMPTLAQGAELKQIRIAVPDLSAGTQHSGDGITDVLQQQQLLEKAFAADGISIQWNYFKGAGPVINEAFANGQVDFAYLGDLAAIIGKANGVDTRLVAATARGVKHYLGVVPGSGIKTLQDLKGKRVAVFRGEKDLKVINLDFSAAIAALAARQIDATWGSTGISALADRGLAELPLNTRDLGGAGNVQAVLVAAGAFVDAYPAVVEKFVAAQQPAVQWLTDDANKDAYIQLVSERASYPPAILQRDLSQERLSAVFDSTLDPDFLARLQASVDLAAQQRLIRKPFKVDQWLAPQATRPAPVAQAGGQG